MLPIPANFASLPKHLQGPAFLYAADHGYIPPLAKLLRRYGKADTLGDRDRENMSVTVLSRLYAVSYDPSDDQPGTEIDASYARHCQLTRELGENVVRDLAAGVSIAETARRNSIDRKTIQRAFLKIRDGKKKNCRSLTGE